MIEKFCNTNFTSYEDFYNNFKINVPKDFNFGYDVVDEWAKTNPDKIALIWCDDDDNEKTFTFQEISEYSSQCAHYFRSLGIQKGDSVMLILKRRYEYWFAIIALHKIGAIAIPATFQLTTKDVKYRVNLADIKMVICCDDKHVLDAIDEAQADLPILQNKILVNGHRDGWLDLHQGMEGMSKSYPRPTDDQNTHNEDPMLIYFTSGTTGMPKMVLHNFTYPLGHILTAKFWHNLHENSIHLTVADPGWAKASWGKIYGQWICGAALFVYDMVKFIPAKVLDKIARHKITSFCAPPTIYRFLIKEDIKKSDFASLEYACTAGEPLNAEVFTQFKKITGIEIKEGFGQSESTPLIATFPWMEAIPGSLGKPSPIYYTELLDHNGNPVDPGEEGEICVRVADGIPVGLFQGYYKNKEKTDEVWYDGYYHTGDMAWTDENGYIWFVGRADDVIKSSGYRIGPFEVESALIEHPSVVECAISAVPDPIRGQIVKATIVLARNYHPSDQLKVELQEHVKRVTAPYKYPRIIEFVDELPKTLSGKIKRAEIRAKDANRHQK